MEARGRGRAKRGRGQEGANRGQPRPGSGAPQQGQAPQGAWSQQRQQGPPPQQGAWGQQQQQRAPPPQQQGAWGQQQQQRGPPPQQQGGWGKQPQQGGPPPQPQGAWGKQQGGAPQQQGAWGQQSQPQQPHLGRGSRQGGDVETSRPIVEQQNVVRGGGDAGLRDPSKTERGGGNGGVRGRSNRNEIIHTKPASVTSKQGASGRPIKLYANYFELITHPDWCLYQFRVDFNPAVDETRIRKKLVYTALKDKKVGGYLFDGTCLYTPIKLHPDPMEVFAKDDNDQHIQITIRMVSNLQWGDHHYLSIFNIIVRKCLTLLKLQLMGREYYDPHAKVTIPEYQMELWPGYYTSIRQHEKKILMCSELTFKMIRTDNVYDLMVKCFNEKQGAAAKEDFMRKVIGSIVLTNYNNKTYRIDDIDFNITPLSTFKKKDGSSISYKEYFKQKYNLRIHDDNQPMLLSQSKPREIRAGMPELVYLVPEFCQMTGLTDEQRSNFHLMSAMATHTRVAPDKRIQKLVEFARKLNSNQEIMTTLKSYDLKIADSLVQLSGRVLPTEFVVAGNEKKYSAGPKADWTRDLRSNQMLSQNDMVCMPLIVPQRAERDAGSFLSTLIKAAGGMQWNLSKARIFPIRDDRSMTYLSKLDEVMSFNPTLIMCGLTSKSADRYNTIKKKCCVDIGVPTQVVLTKQFHSKGVMSIATKIAIQLNCKIGGAPWVVPIPLKHLMIVGYDVCRDTENKKKSFAGMVASLNSNCTRYYSSATEHEYEEEISNNFAAFILLACHQYKKIHGVFPERILIYRDGVGDGQLSYVYEHEVQAIKNKLESEIYTSNNLKMAFVIVSKRHKTRIFGQDGSNPPPGTVADDVITLPERYDFFIVSQCVNQGTVAPTNFNVIYDTMGLPPDRMQQLSYKLTHMYYNWSGTVRVPAPCQYAHKLAFLVAQNLHRSAHKNLETLLYFL